MFGYAKRRMLKQFIRFGHASGSGGVWLFAQDIGLECLAKMVGGLSGNPQFTGKLQTRFAFENATNQQHHFLGTQGVP